MNQVISDLNGQWNYIYIYIYIYIYFFFFLIFPVSNFPGRSPSWLWNLWNVYILPFHPPLGFKAGMSNTISIRSPLGQWKFFEMVVTPSLVPPACYFWLPAIFGGKRLPRGGGRGQRAAWVSPRAAGSSRHPAGRSEGAQEQWSWAPAGLPLKARLSRHLSVPGKRR